MINDNKNSVSVLIPAYKSKLYIEECIKSILNQNTQFKFEILIGIDGCYDTMEYIKNNKTIIDNCRIIFFHENVGPYIVRNTLVTLSMYSNLIFFDSDDIMFPNLVQDTITLMKEYDSVRWRFYNFEDKKENKKENSWHAHGVFGIKKSVFLEHNGFHSWNIGSDTEFKERMVNFGVNIFNTSDFYFLRRYHDESQTRNKKTGMGTPSRIEAISRLNEMRGKNNYKDPKRLIISDYIFLSDFEDTSGHPFNSYFDKIYCVNLDRREDKWNKISNLFEKNKIDVDRFSAIDGNIIDSFILDKYDINKYAVGCIYSHYEIVKEAKQKGYKKILIFEDDVIFTRNYLNIFLNKIKCIKDWKLLYLGSSQYDWKNLEYISGFYYSKKSLGTFAYAIDSSIYDDILNTNDVVDIPIDTILSKFIQEKYYGMCYTFFPNVVIADVSDSNIRDSRSPEDHYPKMQWDILNL